MLIRKCDGLVDFSRSFFLLVIGALASFQVALARGQWNWEGGGSMKFILGNQELNQTQIYPKDQVPFNEERFRFQGAISHPYFRLEVAEELFFNAAVHNPPVFAMPDTHPTSAWNARWSLYQQPNVSAYHRLDRLFAQVKWQDLQLIVGKQVIATGVGQIFTAVSQVQRYPFDFIDPEYPKTEDAATVIWSGPLQLEARFLPKTSGQRKDNFHLRAKGNKNNFDVALTTGRSDDKFYLGMETAGNFGDALVRGELVGYEAGEVDYLQALLGFDYVFSAKWSGKFECFYNGFGQTNAPYVLPTQLLHRTAPFLGRWYAALALSWEIHPLFKSHFTSVVNLRDPSTLLNLSFDYSLSNSLDLLFGQFYNLGSSISEFGGQTLVSPPNFKLGAPNITYAALRWYY